MSSKNCLTFNEFNTLVNVEDTECYVELKNKIPIHSKPLKIVKYEDILTSAKENKDLEIGWIIKEGYIVIDIDNEKTGEIVFNIIKAREEKVLVCKTNRGYHIYAKSTFNYKTTNNILACGAFADTIVRARGQSYITTPFKNPKVNESENLKNREVIYYNGIEDLPFWLMPTTKVGRKLEDAIINYPHAECRNDSYNRQLWRLKTSSLTAKQRDETLHIINDYVATSPLSEDEMNATMLREENNADLPEKEFFNGNGTFLHNKLGDFIINYLNIRKGQGSNLLYHYNEKKNIYETNEEYLKGQMTLLVPYLKEHQKNETLYYLNSKLELEKTMFNKSPYTIVFKNGVLDLLTFDFKEHSPQYLETIQVGVNFNPSAYSKHVDSFFGTATLEDKELETLLYEAIGYSMLKTAELGVSFILTGSGRTGKSTYLDLIKAIVGEENSTTVDFKELSKNFGIGGLAGKLVSLAADISNQRISESDTFKKIVTGDMVRVDEKYEKKYDTVLFCTLFFSANDLPRTPDTGDAFYRRLMIMPFNADLTNVDKVAGMAFKAKLLMDESLEYAAYKAVLAIKRVFDTNYDFTKPAVCMEELQKYKVINSSVLTWALEVGENIIGKDSKFLYEAYGVWVEVNNYKTVGKQRFDKELCAEYNLELISGKFKKIEG